MDLTCDTKSYHLGLFQKNKGVKIIAVGVGDPKKFKQSEFMHKIVGTKGKLILKEDFDELLKRLSL